MHPKAAHLALLGFDVFAFHAGNISPSVVCARHILVRVMRTPNDSYVLHWSDDRWLVQSVTGGDHYRRHPAGWAALPDDVWAALPESKLNEFIEKSNDL